MKFKLESDTDDESIPDLSTETCDKITYEWNEWSSCSQTCAEHYHSAGEQFRMRQFISTLQYMPQCEVYEKRDCTNGQYPCPGYDSLQVDFLLLDQ